MTSTADKTGASFKKVTLPKFNEIKLQGKVKSTTKDSVTDEVIQAGTFKLIDLLTNDKKVSLTQLGTSVEFVLLKMRRRMEMFVAKENKTWRVPEHATKEDMVPLFGSPEKIKAKSVDLKAKYGQPMKIIFVVYGYVPQGNEKLPAGIYRFLFHGSQLGIRQNEESRVGLFDYLKSFQKDDEHVHQFVTKVTGVVNGDNYSVNFERGAVLSPDQLKKVDEMIDKIYERINAVDEHYKKLSPKEEVTEDTEEPQIDVGSDDEEDEEDSSHSDADPNDIPF